MCEGVGGHTASSSHRHHPGVKCQYRSRRCAERVCLRQCVTPTHFPALRVAARWGPPVAPGRRLGINRCNPARHGVSRGAVHDEPRHTNAAAEANRLLRGRQVGSAIKENSTAPVFGTGYIANVGGGSAGAGVEVEGVGTLVVPGGDGEGGCGRVEVAIGVARIVPGPQGVTHRGQCIVVDGSVATESQGDVVVQRSFG